ncbi:hypothetical protein [Rhodopirellula europaea]|uniref:hypothetical protein n=1 Tax=Rhodopirellula europaea TaxID=1263866 RepID=UPI003D2801E2
MGRANLTSYSRGVRCVSRAIYDAVQNDLPLGVLIHSPGARRDRVGDHHCSFLGNPICLAKGHPESSWVLDLINRRANHETRLCIIDRCGDGVRVVAKKLASQTNCFIVKVGPFMEADDYCLSKIHNRPFDRVSKKPDGTTIGMGRRYVHEVSINDTDFVSIPIGLLLLPFRDNRTAKVRFRRSELVDATKDRDGLYFKCDKFEFELDNPIKGHFQRTPTAQNAVWIGGFVELNPERNSVSYVSVALIFDDTWTFVRKVIVQKGTLHHVLDFPVLRPIFSGFAELVHLRHKFGLAEFAPESVVRSARPRFWTR